MFRVLIECFIKPIVKKNLVPGAVVLGTGVLMLLGFQVKNMKTSLSASSPYNYENQVSRIDNQEGEIRGKNENKMEGDVLGKGYSNETKEKSISSSTPILQEGSTSQSNRNSDDGNLIDNDIGGAGEIDTFEKSQTINNDSDSQVVLIPTSSFNSEQSASSSTPTLTPTPTESSFPTSAPIPTAISVLTPTLTFTPTPTPDSVPTETKSSSLFSYNQAVPNADGKITITAKENPNGYWDFIISGSFRLLQPNRAYQLWLCQANGLDCSSHTSAKFITDENGSASLSGATINYPQGKYPLAKVLVWGLKEPENENGCLSYTGAPPCLESSISF